MSSHSVNTLSNSEQSATNMSFFMKENRFARKDAPKCRKFKIGDVVKLSGLKTRALNGQTAEIVNNVIVKRNGERRWPVLLKNASKQRISIKERNLKIVGDLIIKYRASIRDGLDEGIAKEFVFEHEMQKAELSKLFSNSGQMIKFLKRISALHQKEMFNSMKWHCAECKGRATKIQSWPMSYLHTDEPFIYDLPAPVCNKMDCYYILNKNYHEMMMQVTNNANSYNCQ